MQGQGARDARAGGCDVRSDDRERQDRQGGAAREIPRRARQAAARGRQCAVSAARRPALALQARSLRRADQPRGAVRSRHLRLCRRRHRGPRHRRAAGRGRRSTDVRIVEKGGDFGGTWYWNRYPGAQCDTASMVYMPLLEETGHMPIEKYAHGPEILEQCRRIGRKFSPLRQRAVSDRGDRPRMGRERKALGDLDRSRRSFHRELYRRRHRPAARAEAAGHSRHREFQGPFLPHQPLGLRLHRRRCGRRADDRACRQARRHHRHRRHLGAGRAVSRRATQSGCYVVQRTPSSVDVRANAPIDPKWFEGIATPGWQTALDEEFHRQPGRRRRRGRSGAGRLDRSVAAHPQQVQGPAAREPDAGRDAGRLRGHRFREDGGDPRARGFHRRRPRDRAAAESLVPAIVQAAVLPRFLSAGVQQSLHHAGRYRRQGRGAHHRKRFRGGGRPIRGRLHHLCVGLRGRHRISRAAPASTWSGATG